MAYVFTYAVSGRLSTVVQVNATNMEYCSWDICTLSYFPQAPCLTLSYFPQAPCLTLSYFPQAPCLTLSYFPQAPCLTLSYFPQAPCLTPDPKPDSLSFWSFPLFPYTTFGMDSSHSKYFQIQCSNQSMYNLCS
jgi:hypothetical protein